MNVGYVLHMGMDEWILKMSEFYKTLDGLFIKKSINLLTTVTTKRNGISSGFNASLLNNTK